MAISLYKHSCYLCLATCRQFLCTDCEQQISWVTGQASQAQQFCQRCGAEDFHANAPANYCDSCRNAIIQLQAQSHFGVTRNYPLAYYQGLFAELLQWYKFAKDLPLASYLASLLQQAHHAEFSDYFVVPVPPRTAKLKQEAWDPVSYICQQPLPVLKLLQRNATIQQKRLNRKHRLEQLYTSDTYSLALPARRLTWQNYRKKGPLRLVLFDDVYTTGATMDMCRLALRPLEQEGWVTEVRSLSLCLVP